MPKRCPPGVLCIENITVCCLTMLLFILFYLFFSNHTSSTNFSDKFKMLTQSDLMDDKSVTNMYVNIPTQRSGSCFKQVGIAKNNNNTASIILPIMGKQLIASRNTWQYYAMSDQNNSIRLPMSFKGKNCMDEYGCDELTTGDTVYIEGYDDVFFVTIYERNQYSYNNIITSSL